MFNYDFINKENLHFLKSYKYKGVDKSLLYNYIFSPIANWCLQFIPLNIAPNTLSLMGLTCIIIPHLLFLIIMGNQDFSGNVPTYLLWVTVVLHLLYMNFDNLDGKQARRTSNQFQQLDNSSPLGMILDHNFDSMIILIQGTNLATAMQFGNTVYSFALYSIPSVLFYIITHEEYYTHEMNMPMFNAAVEGTFSIAVLFGVTAIYGSRFIYAQGTEMWRWRIPELDNVQVKFICMWIFFASAFLSLPFVLLKIQRFLPLSKLFYKFKYMAFCYLSVLYAILFSPTDVGQTHMRSFLYLIGFTMSKGGVVALNHVSNQDLPEYQNSIFMFICILVNTIYGQIFGVTLFDEGLLIASFAFFAIVIHLHFLYNTSRQISGELRIKIFEINKE